MDIEDIINSIKLSGNKYYPVWKRFYYTIIGLSALTVYGPSVYYKNVAKSTKHALNWQMRLRCFLSILTATIIGIVIWPVLLTGFLTRYLAEKVRYVSTHHALLLTSLIISIIVGSFWICSIPEIAKSKFLATANYAANSKRTANQISKADNEPVSDNNTTSNNGRNLVAKMSEPGVSPSVTPQPSTTEQKTQTEGKQQSDNISSSIPDSGASPGPSSPLDTTSVSWLFDINNLSTYSYSYYYPICLKELGYEQPLSASELNNFPGNLQDCIRSSEQNRPDNNYSQQ